MRACAVVLGPLLAGLLGRGARSPPSAAGSLAMMVWYTARVHGGSVACWGLSWVAAVVVLLYVDRVVTVLSWHLESDTLQVFVAVRRAWAPLTAWVAGYLCCNQVVAAATGSQLQAPCSKSAAPLLVLCPATSPFCCHPLDSDRKVITVGELRYDNLSTRHPTHYMLRHCCTCAQLSPFCCHPLNSHN